MLANDQSTLADQSSFERFEFNFPSMMELEIHEEDMVGECSVNTKFRIPPFKTCMRYTIKGRIVPFPDLLMNFLSDLRYEFETNEVTLARDMIYKTRMSLTGEASEWFMENMARLRNMGWMGVPWYLC
ncbi:hypothetical protein CAAN1_09S00452 [[Candida] anglica]|uniref:Uncharacterized protein n=1 Tax=[Candida] anglica TaxID=148631 RepID=A0ABP0EFC2_9ASCO